MAELVWKADQVSQAAAKVDDLIVAKGMVEMFDGPAAKVILNLANTMVSKYAPVWSWGIFQAGMQAFLDWEIPEDVNE